jgi:hypothetical protein
MKYAGGAAKSLFPADRVGTALRAFAHPTGPLETAGTWRNVPVLNCPTAIPF